MRILIILLFISFNGFTQSFTEVISIQDIDSFKKVCIENNYELYTSIKVKQELKDSGETMQEDSINMLFEDVVWYKKGEDNMIYQKDTESFTIQINRETLWGSPITNDYDALFEDFKRKCTFFKIITTDNGNEYASYYCDNYNVGFKGKIGFRIDGTKGIVWTFPDH